MKNTRRGVIAAAFAAVATATTASAHAGPVVPVRTDSVARIRRTLRGLIGELRLYRVNTSAATRDLQRQVQLLAETVDRLAALQDERPVR